MFATTSVQAGVERGEPLIPLISPLPNPPTNQEIEGLAHIVLEEGDDQYRSFLIQKACQALCSFDSTLSATSWTVLGFLFPEHQEWNFYEALRAFDRNPHSSGYLLTKLKNKIQTLKQGDYHPAFYEYCNNYNRATASREILYFPCNSDTWLVWHVLPHQIRQISSINAMLDHIKKGNYELWWQEKSLIFVTHTANPVKSQLDFIDKQMRAKAFEPLYDRILQLLLEDSTSQYLNLSKLRCLLALLSRDPFGPSKDDFIDKIRECASWLHLFLSETSLLQAEAWIVLGIVEPDPAKARYCFERSKNISSKCPNHSLSFIHLLNKHFLQKELLYQEKIIIITDWIAQHFS